MAKLIHSIVTAENAIAASATETVDLPVNPLSHLILTLRGLNVTNEASLAQILARLDTIAVLQRGANVFNLRGDDLYAYVSFLLGNAPILTNQIATDNAVRDLSIVIPFGRKLYDMNECFPASKRGELQFQITTSADETQLDNLEYILEAVEMPDAKPSRWLKSTFASLTPASGIDNDIALPIGNDFAHFMIFGTTIPTAVAETATVESMRLLIDNVETQIASANWEGMHGNAAHRFGHRQDIDASSDDDDVANYDFIDLSPRAIDDFLLKTAGVSSATFRFRAGDANAMRLILSELVKV